MLDFEKNRSKFLNVRVVKGTDKNKGRYKMNYQNLYIL